MSVYTEDAGVSVTSEISSVAEVSDGDERSELIETCKPTAWNLLNRIE